MRATAKIMIKKGYRVGKGLGKNLDGITRPIQLRDKDLATNSIGKHHGECRQEVESKSTTSMNTSLVVDSPTKLRKLLTKRGKTVQKITYTPTQIRPTLPIGLFLTYLLFTCNVITLYPIWGLPMLFSLNQ
ncbi:hypothetical protein CR513_57199, partial [Mucuna pruriens]